ncbi:MAG: hypothetical protein AAGK32_22660, partial [Actinomycetota bacterium]
DMLDVGVPEEVSVTTNGTVLHDRAEDYLRDLRMHPIVSVDGTAPGTVEAIRVGVDGARLWQHIDRVQQISEETGAGMTLSFCLMVESWPEVGGFLEEVDRRGEGVYPNVVRVQAPEVHSLRSLDQVELRTILGHLRDERGRADPRSSDVLRVWQEVLDWVEVLSR